MPWWGIVLILILAALSDALFFLVAWWWFPTYPEESEPEVRSRASKWWQQVRCWHDWKYVRAVPKHWADIYRCSKCGKEVEEEYNLEK